MDFAFARIALLHNKSSHPPPGLAFGEPDDRLQRVSSTPRLYDFIISVSGILDRPLSRTMTAGDSNFKQPRRRSPRHCRA